MWPAAVYDAGPRSLLSAIREPETEPMARVLIADDEDSMRKLVARAITLDGHEAIAAQDGAEALEILVRDENARPIWTPSSMT